MRWSRGQCPCTWTGSSLSIWWSALRETENRRLHAPCVHVGPLIMGFHLCLQLCDTASLSRLGGRFVFINHVYVSLRLCLLDWGQVKGIRVHVYPDGWRKHLGIVWYMQRWGLTQESGCIVKWWTVSQREGRPERGAG